MVVTDLHNPEWKYYFPCGQWLAADEGDGATSRDLIGSRDPLSTRKGNVRIHYIKCTVYRVKVKIIL